MLTLAATGTVQGLAGSGSAITYSLTGLDNGAAKVTQGVLTTGALPLWTAGAGTGSHISSIILCNTTAGSVTVTLYINGTATANQFATIPVPANGEATFTTAGWVVTSAVGAVLFTIPLSATTPTSETVGGSGSAGSTGLASDSGHAHPIAALTDGTHGSLGGGSDHALAIAAGANGFLSGTDKTKLNNTSGTNTGDQTITLTSDVTGSGTGSFATTLKNTGPGATGPIGSATAVPVVTIDAQGRTTALTSTSIAIPESAVTNLTTDLAAKVATTQTISTTPPLTGGGDLSAPRTFAISAATTAAAGSLSALDKLKLNDVWKDVVTDGGLNNTGASDNTALLQALHDALPANGGVLFFPQGTYRFDSTVNITKEGVYLLGQGRRTVKLCTTSATLDMFNVTGDATLFEGLRFTTMVAGVADNAALRTAGYAVTFTSSSDSSGMRKCDILFQWSGIQSSGSLHFFDDLNIREYGANAINGACILVNGTGDRYITRLTTDNGANQTGFAGIRITECASCVISDSNIIHATTALALEPATGKTVPSVEVTNTFFDTSVIGMGITPAGTGQVLRCKFTNCWFGTHTTAGVRMTGTQWDGITFDNCEFYANPGVGIGIDCPSGGGKWTLSNSRIAGFATGINLTASAAHYPLIIGNVIGPSSAFGANTTGIAVAAGTYKGLQITDNAIVNNTTNVTLGAVAVTAGEGSFYQIKDNAGYNPLTGAAVTTPTIPTSTTVVTNTTGRRVLVMLKNGSTTMSSLSVNGVVAGVPVTASQLIPITLEPGGTINFTYTVAPTWVWIGQ